MANKKGLVVTLRIEGARETLRAFKSLPKEADAALRDASQRIAQTLAGRIKTAARSEGRQAALLASTVKARRDRLPAVVAGGVKRVGRNRKPAYKLLFGSEFGSNRLKQFKPHLGRGSYWFFRTVEDGQSDLSRQWSKAADEVARAFVRDGD